MLVLSCGSSGGMARFTEKHKQGDWGKFYHRYFVLLISDQIRNVKIPYPMKIYNQMIYSNFQTTTTHCSLYSIEMSSLYLGRMTKLIND